MAMKEGKVIWKHGMSFTGSGQSGFELPIGTAPEFGGDNDGFSPMELILIGMAGCTALDVMAILKKKAQDVTGFEVVARGERAESHPRVYTHVQVEYIVTGRNVQREAVERAVELSETKYCSVQAMISKTAKIESVITLREA